MLRHVLHRSDFPAQQRVGEHRRLAQEAVKSPVQRKERDFRLPFLKQRPAAGAFVQRGAGQIRQPQRLRGFRDFAAGAGGVQHGRLPVGCEEFPGHRPVRPQGV